MKPYAIISVLSAAAVLVSGCRTPGQSRAKGLIQAASFPPPLTRGPQINRTFTRLGQARHILLAIPPTPVVNPTLKELTKNFDPNAILYCDGVCAPPEPGQEWGRQGISTGPFMESSRRAVHGDNWIQFKFSGEGTYISKNESNRTADLSPAGDNTFEYRVVWSDAENAKLLPATTSATTGEHTIQTADYGYRMKYLGDQSWLRYNSNAPNDTSQQYKLKVVFNADGSETHWTNELFEDNKISHVDLFTLAVPLSSSLASGDLPDGPDRGDLAADPSDAKKRGTDADPKGQDAKGGRNTDPSKVVK